jgi:hypothetical protein
MSLLRCITIALILLGFNNQSKAQILDTLRVLMKGRSSIDLRLESRVSVISHDAAKITGIRIGASFNRKLKMGVGLSWLKNDITQPGYVINELNKQDTITKYLKFGYICYYLDFVFYKTKRWQLSVPIQAGTGMSWWQTTKRYDVNGDYKKSFLLLYEPGISTQFKLFRFLGVGADVGYRFTLRNNKYVGDRLNSPVYAFKVLFWADQLYYELFPKHKITQKYGPAAW